MKQDFQLSCRLKQPLLLSPSPRWLWRPRSLSKDEAYRVRESGSHQSAFTLIELLAVIFLVGLLASLMGPLLHRKKPQETWEIFHDHLNQLASFVRQEAITKRRVYRLVFEQKQNKQARIFVEEEYQDLDHADKKLYRLVEPIDTPTKLMLEYGRSLRAVYVGRQNALSDQAAAAYCFVIPDGMMQPVTVQVVKAGKGAEEIVSFQLNPFLGTFDRYEGKLKPE